MIHIGCGMDSRVERVNALDTEWYDVDFLEVIEERKKYYEKSEKYHMIAADARTNEWLEKLPKNKEAVIIMEGVSMYFESSALQKLLENLNNNFSKIHLLMDCYTEFAAKASKYKNPINDVGVTQVYGVDVPEILNVAKGLSFIEEHEMTPETLMEELKGMERKIFEKVFVGDFAKKMYRLYEYKK